MPPPEELRQALRERAFPAAPDSEARAAARSVAEQAGPSVLAVVFFGSRKTGARPDAFSAHDFFVITRDYRAFYGALGRSGALRRPRLAAGLNTVLPPNQISLSAPGPGLRLKCAVLSMEAFLRETSPRRGDHFLLGRLFQPAEVLHTAGPLVAEQVLDGLVSACRMTYSWSRPWLPGRFAVEDYCRTLLRVSFAAEIRPEPAGRADALWQAQQEALRPIYARLLAELAGAGELREEEPGLYALAKPAGAGERVRLAVYFRWSLLRATARWAKHMVTFEGWLDFIVRKAQRHTGQQIELTPRERRLPLLFLWPRLFRYLRHKDGREGGRP